MATWFEDLAERLLHAASFGPIQDGAKAVTFYSAMQRIQKGKLDLSELDCNALNRESELRRAAEIIWSVGDTLALPEGHSPLIDACLLLPNSTQLDSSAQLLVAALQQVDGMVESLRSWEKRHSLPECGEAVDLGSAGRFARVQHLICREPGNADLIRLTECLIQATSSYDPHQSEQLIVPVWGSEGDLSLWADALNAWCDIDGQMSWAPRIPIHLRFLPEHEGRGERLQKLLRQRGRLVIRDTDVDWEVGARPEDQIPDAVLAEVGREKRIDPVRFGRWMRCGYRLSESSWMAHLERW